MRPTALRLSVPLRSRLGVVARRWQRRGQRVAAQLGEEVPYLLPELGHLGLESCPACLELGHLGFELGRPAVFGLGFGHPPEESIFAPESKIPASRERLRWAHKCG